MYILRSIKTQTPVKLIQCTNTLDGYALHHDMRKKKKIQRGKVIKLFIYYIQECFMLTSYVRIRSSSLMFIYNIYVCVYIYSVDHDIKL